jgi:hypothetical protein
MWEVQRDHLAGCTFGAWKKQICEEEDAPYLWILGAWKLSKARLYGFIHDRMYRRHCIKPLLPVSMASALLSIPNQIGSFEMGMLCLRRVSIQDLRRDRVSHCQPCEKRARFWLTPIMPEARSAGAVSC